MLQLEVRGDAGRKARACSGVTDSAGVRSRHVGGAVPAAAPPPRPCSLFSQPARSGPRGTDHGSRFKRAVQAARPGALVLTPAHAATQNPVGVCGTHYFHGAAQKRAPARAPGTRLSQLVQRKKAPPMTRESHYPTAASNELSCRCRCGATEQCTCVVVCEAASPVRTCLEVTRKNGMAQMRAHTKPLCMHRDCAHASNRADASMLCIVLRHPGLWIVPFPRRSKLCLLCEVKQATEAGRGRN